MILRTCNTAHKHRKFFGRLRDKVKYGHTKHVCQILRPLKYEHETRHQCHCGLKYGESVYKQ